MTTNLSCVLANQMIENIQLPDEDAEIVRRGIYDYAEGTEWPETCFTILEILSTFEDFIEIPTSYHRGIKAIQRHLARETNRPPSATRDVARRTMHQIRSVVVYGESLYGGVKPHYLGSCDLAKLKTRVIPSTR